MKTTTLISTLSAVALGTASAQDKPVRGEDFVRAPAIAGGLCVSNAFQSNMVLQRDQPVAVWGWAAPGEEVAVSIAGKTATTKAGDDRMWRLELEPLPANNKPATMTVRGKSDTLTLENILVGDVWLLGGQSNMEFPISKVDEGKLEIVSANFPQIRLLTMPQGKGFESVASFERLHEWSGWSSRHFAKGDWEICSPETVTEFSAIGYVFGRRLAMATGVPIGLIDASVGGTTVETWTPQEVIKEIDGEETRELLATWSEKIATYDAQADLEKRVANFVNRQQRFAKEGKDVPPDSEKPTDLRPGPVADRNRPGYCYSSIIRPLQGLTIKGALFHQGFNNCFNGSAGARMYAQVFPEMIAAWRSTFGSPSMPFCVISLCTAGEPQTEDNFLEPMYDVGPLIREAQHQAYSTLREAGDENIGFVSSFDLRKTWYHPQIKVPAGERAAKWALATQFEILTGRDGEHYWLPPSIEEVNIADGAIHLKLSTEVRTHDDSDGKMLGFAIAGTDRRFYPAAIDYGSDGTVDNRNRPRYQKNTLVLSSPHVPEPAHYRYAWARNPMANIVNKYGVPIATQRSDGWILEETPGGITPPENMDPNSIDRWLRGQNRNQLKKDDLERRIAEAKATLAELEPEAQQAN